MKGNKEIKIGDKVYTSNPPFGFLSGTIKDQEMRNGEKFLLIKVEKDSQKPTAPDELWANEKCCFATYAELSDFEKTKSEEIMEKYRKEIQTKEDLVRFMFIKMNEFGLGDDFEVTYIIKEKAKVLMGIDLNDCFNIDM